MTHIHQSKVISLWLAVSNMISIIAAIGKNNEFGKDNKMIWHLPGDLPRFKRITWGRPVIMGKNTHSTFQYNDGPLPGRTNIVLSSDKSFKKKGFVVAHSIKEALNIASKSPGKEEIFIIGGASVIKQTLPIADKLYLTKIDASFEADTFMPDYSRFSKIVSTDPQKKGEYKFIYYILEPED
ncbi:dihydrofolate reductase [Patescibacteria group bacterium]